MLPFWVVEMMARQKMSELDEEAERARFLQSNVARPLSFPSRLAVSFAALLIATGTLIQKHYTPSLQPQPDPDCTSC